MGQKERQIHDCSCHQGVSLFVGQSFLYVTQYKRERGSKEAGRASPHDIKPRDGLCPPSYNDSVPCARHQSSQYPTARDL